MNKQSKIISNDVLTAWHAQKRHSIMTDISKATGLSYSTVVNAFNGLGTSKTVDKINEYFQMENANNEKVDC